MNTDYKNFLRSIPGINTIARSVARAIGKKKRGNAEFAGSGTYWESRYQSGGNSGRGSYGELAQYKADYLNSFVQENRVESVIEFGCGDGNQLLLAKYPNYIGFDVSETAVSVCREKFAADPAKAFRLVEDYQGDKADLTLSLDVIYHLVEDHVFEEYMKLLFESATRFVIIYSSNCDERQPAPHVRHRLFSDKIDKDYRDWRLVQHVKNPHPLVPGEDRGSFADFFAYSKLISGSN